MLARKSESKLIVAIDGRSHPFDFLYMCALAGAVISLLAKKLAEVAASCIPQFTPCLDRQ
jgi:hypothetical protein